VTLLLLKISLTPALVVGSSLAGRRWGAAASGALVALPVVVGPILFFVAIEQGDGYVSAAATSSLLGLVGLTGFIVVYVLLAQTRGWPASVIAGMAASLLVDLMLSRVTVDPGIGLVVAILAFCSARSLVSRFPAEPHSRDTEWRWDLPARAASTVLLVMALTGAARALGPELTGALAPFPIALSVMVVFAHAQGGAACARQLLLGFLAGANGFATFCFLIAELSQPLGTAVTFVLAVLAAVAVQLTRRRRRSLRIVWSRRRAGIPVRDGKTPPSPV
jgi:hypothetical protein